MSKQTFQHTSKESSLEELELARREGEAFAKTVEYMLTKEAHGAKQRAGDYLIGYAVEDAEGLYQMQDGHLQWREPEAENAHIEIVVCDAANGRFIPCLNVFAALFESNGTKVGRHHQPFLWHPWLYHYGRNWNVPGDGLYSLRVRVEVPHFMRHDKINGKRFNEPVEVEFKDVKIKTGRKLS